MNQTEFIKYFLSEHIIGSTQMAIKKLLNEKRSHVPVEFSYMPVSHMYCVFNKSLFEKTPGNHDL